MIKKLHELIEMAKRGEKFTASSSIGTFNELEIKDNTSWHFNYVTADWTVRMKLEPRVIWISEDIDFGFSDQVFYTKEELQKYSDGKPVKFIEVLDEEKS